MPRGAQAPSSTARSRELMLSYDLAPDFERYICKLATESKTFWPRLGWAVQAELLRAPEAQAIWMAISAFHRAHGRPPTSEVIVLQQLAQQVSNGKLTQQLADAAQDFLDAAPQDDVEEQAIAAFAPIVRAIARTRALEKLHEAWSNPQEDAEQIRRARKYIDLVDTIGLVPRDTTPLDVSAQALMDEIANHGAAERLATYVFEVDDMLSGGPPLSTFSWIAARSGDGKSQWLTQVACSSARQGHFTGFLSLELPRASQGARAISHLTGIPVTAIERDERMRRRAQQRMEHLAPTIAPLVFDDMKPRVTTVATIADWVEEQEQRLGRKMRTLVIDYTDKLTDPAYLKQGLHIEMDAVYEACRRDLAVARQMWVWGATQVNRQVKGTRIQQEDISDSSGKIRVADQAIFAKREDADGGEEQSMIVSAPRVTIGCLKDRFGPATGRITTAIQTCWKNARFSEWETEIGDWSYLGI